MTAMTAPVTAAWLAMGRQWALTNNALSDDEKAEFSRLFEQVKKADLAKLAA